MNTTANEIENIKELLPMLSETFLHEVKDFTQYLLEKQKKRKAFEEQVLKAEQGPYTEYHTVEEVMQAIRNAPEDEND